MAIVAGVAARDMRLVLARGYAAVMAGAASSQYLGMVDRICRRPKHVVVAVFADIGRIDVRRILTGSFDAVMASETVVGDTGMVIPGRRPERRLVTILAVVAGGKVVGRLACCRNTIVAGSTATGHGCVIHERNRAPGRCRMAVGAQGGCRHMVQTFGRRSHEALRRVTVDAGRAGALEHTAGVTALARNPCMCAIERKACTEMVERLFGPHVHRNEKQQQEYGNCNRIIQKLRRVPVLHTLA